MTDTRFIEESFPAKEIGAISANEKYIRTGNISTLHIWWARRPMAASRATAYAALTPTPDNIEEWQKKRDFIIELSKWENSLNETLLERARKEILDANGGVAPRVLDPFSGGGSYPLEALRLGCEVYANDYNPVAVLILKATLQYPPKFGKPTEVDADTKGEMFTRKRTMNPLLESVKKWGDWVLEEARKELAQFYPDDPDGASSMSYIWARTIPCQNPDCGSEIPLMRQFWLVKNKRKRVALHIYPMSQKPTFHIVGDGYDEWPEGFDADKGTVDRAHATCPYCGTTMSDKTTRKLFKEGKAGQRMIVVVLQYPKKKTKFYRAATLNDEQPFRNAEKELVVKREKLLFEWGMEPIPDEPIERVPFKFGVINVWVYGMNTWGDLFNSRQKLALITLTDKIRKAHEYLLTQEQDSEFAEAVSVYLGLALSRFTNRMSSLAYWYIQGEKIQPTFVRQALGMVWDYVELNPFGTSSGSWYTNMEDGLNVIEQISATQNTDSFVSQNSATRLEYQNNYFDAVLTDPPYYDNVPYSYLSDFFYVWLKRSLGALHPELFSTPLTPKSNEIVAYTDRDNNYGQTYFEESLKKAFQEIYRILKPNGIAVIVYAHKSTQGWETLINSLLDSGLIMTGAWPINTEMRSRVRASDSAVLASSIYIVARKMERLPTGFYNEVREEMRQHLNRKLHRLWEEGVSGADFFIAAIGSAIEVFGKYEQVMDFEGNIVRAARMLDEVQTIATDYAVHQILQNGFSGEVTELTRFYVLWRWNYGDAKMPFDEARKLAQSCSMDLAREWKRSGSFIKQQKDVVRVLGPQYRKVDDLKDTTELIDTLHCVLLLWEKGKRDDMIKTLAHSPQGRSEVFYRVAQAISQSLPVDNREKKMLDGFLAGRERVQDEVNNVAQQQKLL
jgi:putative DNA methylase